jgi:hypothetical protein
MEKLSKLVTVAEKRATKRCKQKEREENKECRERKYGKRKNTLRNKTPTELSPAPARSSESTH